MTRQKGHSWQVRETPFGYCSDAVFPPFDLQTVLGSDCVPFWVFSPKSSETVFIGLGIHHILSLREVQGFETPLFYSWPYDLPADPQVVVPKMTVVQTKSESHVYLYADKPLSVSECEARCDDLKRLRPLPQVHFFSRQEVPNKEQWAEQVRDAILTMRSGTLDKVVLSRKSIFGCTSRWVLPPESHVYNPFLSKLRDAARYHYLYRTQNMVIIGHSPEALLSVAQDRLSVDVVAGTRPSDVSYSLLNSDKDKREHDIVLSYVRDILSRYEMSLQETVRQEIQVGELTHLYQQVRATGKMALVELLHALHPTPAVCGFPKQKAQERISQIETTDRGWYGGLIGCAFEGNWHVAVMLRGLQLSDSQAVVQVGAGIVPDSDPEKEWQELEIKRQSILSGFRNAE